MVRADRHLMVMEFLKKEESKYMAQLDQFRENECSAPVLADVGMKVEFLREAQRMISELDTYTLIENGIPQ